MIEGEQIFESAQETGYRLCRSRDVAVSDNEELVFSAHWDLNVPNRLHVCLQNGQLKVFNVEDKSSERYDVLFRRYTPVFENNNQTEKRVTFHWDKMTTIPDRPDEVVFLLGISRTLMYTALPPPEDRPYPEMPLLASTARGDFPGFIFGSPIMEISSHHTRVTSMVVSPAGHILASGDESGNVRLLLLRLLDEISVFKQNERRKKKHSAVTSFSQFLPTYNVTVPAHDGPVFSMQWLPILSASQSNNVRNYALVTGSADRSVRIWRVCCCSSRGISMTPAMVLDTLSTHVLSLNSCLYTDRFALAKINRVEAFSNRAMRSLSRASSFSSVFSFGGDAEPEQQPPNGNAAKSIFLAAGTSVGTIYVWKLSYMEVHEAISPQEDAAPGTVVERRPVVSDDGTKIYSLLQTSDRPIIHVTLSAYPAPSLPLSPGQSPSKAGLPELATSSGGEVVLAASDTQGTVHLYTPELAQYEGGGGQASKRQVRELAELAHHPLYDEYRRKMSPVVESAAQALAPLVRIGEQSFSSAVVSCCFPPAYPNDDLPSSPFSSPLNTPNSKSQASAPPHKAQLSKWDPAAMVQRSGPLLVGCANGEICLYDSSDLAALSSGLHEPDEREPGGEFALSRTADDISVSSTDSDVKASDRQAVSRKNSMRDQQAAKSALVAAARAGQVTSESDADSTHDAWEDLQIARKTVHYAAPSAPLPQNTRSAGPGGRKSNIGKVEEEEEECSEYPRSQPPPAPLPAASKQIAQVPRPSAAGKSKLDKPATTQGSPASNYSRRSGSPSNEIAHQAQARDDGADLSVTDTTSVPSSPMSSLPSPPRFLKDRIQSRAAQEAPRANPLSVPVQTVSKVLENQVRNLAEKLDNDEISVATQHTSRSDQLAAAGAAQAAVARPRRYVGLTPVQYLDAADLDALLAEARPDRMRPKLHKQVDSEWLSNRKFGGPSAEDMSPLENQDPLVPLRLCCSGPASARSEEPRSLRAEADGRCKALLQEYRYNSAFGLRGSTAADTLSQHFHNEVNMDQIFGKFDARAADRLSAQAREQSVTANLLGLVGAASVF